MTSTEDSKKQESPTASPNSLSHRPANSGSSVPTHSGNGSQVPYEVYLQMSEAEREAIPYERKPFRLTPSEIVSLRQDSIATMKRFCEMDGVDFAQIVI